MAEPDGAVGLSDAIEALRQELAAAAVRGRGHQLRFKPGPIELTVQVTLTKEIEGHAGVRWWVLDAGGSGSAANTSVQTVKLTLEPMFLDSAGDLAGEQLIDDADD